MGQENDIIQKALEYAKSSSKIENLELKKGEEAKIKLMLKNSVCVKKRSNTKNGKNK